MEMDNAQIHNIHEAGLWQFESLWLGTQSSVATRWDQLCGLISQKICDLFVGTNKTVLYHDTGVRIKRVSVEGGSTV